MSTNKARDFKRRPTTKVGTSNFDQQESHVGALFNFHIILIDPYTTLWRGRELFRCANNNSN